MGFDPNTTDYKLRCRRGGPDSYREIDTLDLGLILSNILKILKCRRGGIGRHARLRI